MSVDPLYFLIIGLGLVAIVAELRVMRLRKKAEGNPVDHFRAQCQRLLETNKLDELAAFARPQIRQRPNQVTAHWYLARADVTEEIVPLQQKWAEALAAFNEVARLDPSWIERGVTPHVREIEAKLQQKAMPPAPDAADNPRTLH